MRLFRGIRERLSDIRESIVERIESVRDRISDYWSDDDKEDRAEDKEDKAVEDGTDYPPETEQQDEIDFDSSDDVHDTTDDRIDYSDSGIDIAIPDDGAIDSDDRIDDSDRLSDWNDYFSDLPSVDYESEGGRIHIDVEGHIQLKDGDTIDFDYSLMTYDDEDLIAAIILSKNGDISVDDIDWIEWNDGDEDYHVDGDDLLVYE